MAIILIDCIFEFQEFYVFYQSALPDETEIGSTTINEETDISLKDQFRIIMKHSGGLCLNVFLLYCVSLTLFPTVLGRVEQIDSKISNQFFSLVYCFLFFNVFATIGNLSANYLPAISAEYLWIPVYARLLFVPFFLFNACFTNVRTVGVLFKSDYYFIFGNILFSWSLGYLSSLNMCLIPKKVPKELSKRSGMISSFSAIFGILAGVTISPIWKWLLTL